MYLCGFSIPFESWKRWNGVQNFRLVAAVAGFADSVAPGRRVTSQWEASLSRPAAAPTPARKAEPNWIVH